MGETKCCFIAGGVTFAGDFGLFDITREAKHCFFAGGPTFALGFCGICQLKKAGLAQVVYHLWFIPHPVIMNNE